MILNPSFIDKINRFTQAGKPYLFIIDFEGNQPLVLPLDRVAENGIYYDIQGKSNYKYTPVDSIEMSVQPINSERYFKAFGQIQTHIHQGDTYLINLTFPSMISLNTDLKGVFNASKASFKLLYKDRWVCFSPESFIRIKEDNIFSYPMKGTIDASLPRAKEIILSDPKEQYEHNTIVDLIRNDLSSIADEVVVERFRYVDKIMGSHGSLLQVSSAIRGKLPQDWKSRFGEILGALLPAGSVSGAPKKKTLEIIRKAEGESRGYYTGVFGIFDGQEVESAVAIRFIEKKEDRYYYRSGGGITYMSDDKEEYDELKQKIYVPVI
jgi:para-aminobenzoate synthetase component 1